MGALFTRGLGFANDNVVNVGRGHYAPCAIGFNILLELGQEELATTPFFVRHFGIDWLHATNSMRAIMLHPIISIRKQ
jgi:hypothetical protein